MRQADQYFTREASSESAPKPIRFEEFGRAWQFLTDNGVFAKSGADFGSLLMLRVFLDENPSAAGRFLDIGCGWGLVGCIAGTLRRGLELTMTDVSLRALELTARNVRDFGLAADVHESFAYESITGEFDFILSNPPIRAGKDVVHGITLGAAGHLAPGGRLYIVVRKQQGAESLRRVLEENYKAVRLAERDKGYHILVCEND